jgi:hypothetical protein
MFEAGITSVYPSPPTINQTVSESQDRARKAAPSKEMTVTRAPTWKLRGQPIRSLTRPSGAAIMPPA